MTMSKWPVSSTSISSLTSAASPQRSTLECAGRSSSPSLNSVLASSSLPSPALPTFVVMFCVDRERERGGGRPGRRAGGPWFAGLVVKVAERAVAPVDGFLSA